MSRMLFESDCSESIDLDNLPTHEIVQRQIQDVILAQRKTIDTLQDILIGQEDTVPKKHYEVLVKEYEDERVSHARTTGKLMETQDKLEFAQGEIQIQKQQLRHEKEQFEKTFGMLKSKAMKETVKNVQLENKCNEISRQQEQQEDLLADKLKELKNVSERLEKEQTTHKQKLTEMDLEQQQALYISQMMDQHERKQLPKQAIKSSRTKIS